MEDLEFIKDRLRIIAAAGGNCVEFPALSGFSPPATDEARAPSVNQLLKDLEQLIRVHPGRRATTNSAFSVAEDFGVKMNGTDVIQILLNSPSTPFNARR